MLILCRQIARFDSYGHLIELQCFIVDIVSVPAMPFVPVRIFNNDFCLRINLFGSIDNMFFGLFEEEFGAVVRPRHCSAILNAFFIRSDGKKPIVEYNFVEDLCKRACMFFEICHIRRIIIDHRAFMYGRHSNDAAGSPYSHSVEFICERF